MDEHGTMPTQEPAPAGPPPPIGRGCGILFGLGLIAFGALLLIARYIEFDYWDVFGRFMAAIPWEYAWPGFVLVPGILMLFASLVGTRESSGFAVPGSVLSTIGLILLFQTVTGAWASWSYAWALIPASVGFGLVIMGARTGNADLRKTGSIMIAAFLIAFAGFAFFFEVIIGVGGLLTREMRRLVLPALIIIAGVFVLLASRRSRGGSSGPGPSSGPPA